MAGRKTILVNNHYYHIFNRGIARQPVFFSKRDYQRLVLAFSYYQYKDPPVKLSRLLELSEEIRESYWNQMIQKGKKIVEIVSFVLMPNHFHLLVKQVTDNGISDFMSKSINSYTRYINTKQERVGDLFQGAFKGVFIETDEQLIHVSRYIHLNPYVSSLVRLSELKSYPWSSLPDYLKGISDTAKMEIVLSHFRSPTDYEKFVFDQADYAKRLEEIKHLTLE